MERLREFREAFDFSMAKMRRPVMYLPAAIGLSVPQVLSIGIMGRWSTFAGGASQDALQQWTRQYGGLLSLLIFGLAVALPALVSGITALAKAAVKGEDMGLDLFWGGMGTYYWRVMGADILFALVSRVFFGLVGQPITVWFLNTVGAYFLAAWMAAMALDGVRLVEAISRGAKFAWRNPYLLVPGFVLQTALEWLSGLLLEPMTSTGSTIELASGWAYKALLSGAISGFLYAFFLVMYMRMYMTRREPPLDPAQGPDQ